jgi:hypothetical protein
MVQITHSGKMNLGEFKVDCYVLEDSRRIISGAGMQSALKMLDDDSQYGGTRLSRYLNPTFRTSTCSINTSIISSIVCSILIRICSSKNIYGFLHWPTK